jgi:hypothetical protein
MEKSVELKIYTEKSFTDKSLASLLSQNKAIGMSDYIDYLGKNKICSVLSEESIQFLASFDNGFLRPDKCDAYEPVRERFDETSLTMPVRWLSQPGGALFCKKARSFEVVFENEDFAPIWENGKIMNPSVKSPLFKGTIHFLITPIFFRKKGLSYWVEFLNMFSELICASYGFISLPEDSANSKVSYTAIDRIDKLPLNIFLVNYFGQEWKSIFGSRLSRLNDVEVRLDANGCMIITSLDITVRKCQEGIILKALKG